MFVNVRIIPFALFSLLQSGNSLARSLARSFVRSFTGSFVCSFAVFRSLTSLSSPRLASLCFASPRLAWPRSFGRSFVVFARFRSLMFVNVRKNSLSFINVRECSQQFNFLLFSLFQLGKSLGLIRMG